MTDLFSKVRWGRVLLAGMATHVANVVVAVLLIVVYTLLAVEMGVPTALKRLEHQSVEAQVGEEV